MNQYHCNNQKNYCNEQDSINQFYQNQNFSNNNEVLSETNEFFDFINAASLGELKGVVNFLQKQYCNVNLSDSSGWTALMCAANYGHYNVIKALLDHGANSNLKEFKHGRTALMLAASNGHTRCIEMLVGQGKADIRLKDLNGFTAAYYATHYGHGNNKIIARLLRIPYNSQYANFNNMSSNSINKNNQNSSLDSSNYSNERFNLFLQNHNASVNENNELNQSNFINSDYYNERCFSADANSNHVSLMSSNQGLNEILNRNMPKPRPIFKLRQRRSSPVSQHMIEAVKEKQRHSFSGANQNYYLSNSLRTNSLSIDFNRYSPNNLITDQSFPSLQKNQNAFQYDSVFESPQSSASERQSFSEKSKIDTNFFNFDNLSINNLNENIQKKKSRSTLLSNGSNQSELSDSSNQLDSLEEKNISETKFSNLATTLDEFLAQLGLEELGELFKKKNIDLYTFLSLSELDFKEYGINDLESLATLISGQLKFKELIGVRSSESMNFITFLGNQLEKAKKEIESLKIENQLYKISLITI